MANDPRKPQNDPNRPDTNRPGETNPNQGGQNERD